MTTLIPLPMRSGGARLLLLLQILFAISLCSAAAPPGLLTYQGFLTDDNGVPVGNTGPVNKAIIFRIYTAGNELKWASQQTVTVDKGHFSVLLGEGSANGSEPFAADLSGIFTGGVDDLYLEIEVDSEKIKPRLRFLAAPYAFLAKRANGLVSPDGNSLVTTANGSLTVAGTISGNGFVGSGSGLTAIPAAAIDSQAGALDLQLIPSLPASKITSGRLGYTRIPPELQQTTYIYNLSASTNLVSGKPSRLNNFHTVFGNNSINTYFRQSDGAPLTGTLSIQNNGGNTVFGGTAKGPVAEFSQTVKAGTPGQEGTFYTDYKPSKIDTWFTSNGNKIPGTLRIQADSAAQTIFGGAIQAPAAQFSGSVTASNGKMVGSAETSLQIVRGIVAIQQDSSPTIKSGSGFAVGLSSQPIDFDYATYVFYRVTFDEPFSDQPTVTVTDYRLDNGNTLPPKLRQIGLDHFEVGVAANAQWTFIAIGQR